MRLVERLADQPAGIFIQPGIDRDRAAITCEHNPEIIRSGQVVRAPSDWLQ
jgi:hypothetical protein